MSFTFELRFTEEDDLSNLSMLEEFDSTYESCWFQHGFLNRRISRYMRPTERRIEVLWYLIAEAIISGRGYFMRIRLFDQVFEDLEFGTTYGEEDMLNYDTRRGSGYFLVEPTLNAGGEDITLDCVQCVTYIAKLLGPLDTWEAKLRVAKETGYNMVHFTPIQELGGSNSAYSLQNQLALNPTFAVNGHTPDINELQNLIEKIRNEWKMLSICDIVLNHTANESPWLREHPECTYNLQNCPHLRPAYLLDLTLYKFSLEVSKGLWEFSGVPAEVNCDEHLQAIRHALFGTVLPRVKIPELYLLNIHALVEEFQAKARNRIPPLPTAAPPDYSQLKLVQDPQYRRLHTTVDLELALRLYNVYRSDCFDEDTRLRRCAEDFKKKLEELNGAVYQQTADPEK